MQLERTLGMFKAEKCKLCQRRSKLRRRTVLIYHLSHSSLFSKQLTAITTRYILQNCSLSDHMCHKLYTRLLCPVFSTFQLIGLNQRMNQSGVSTLSRDVKRTQSGVGFPEVSRSASMRRQNSCITFEDEPIRCEHSHFDPIRSESSSNVTTCTCTVKSILL